MKRVSIIGHFAEGLEYLDGQTVKTKIVTEELQNQLGIDQVLKIDTHGGWKVLLKSPFQVFRALKHSANVLIFPAHNGLRVYAPLLFFLRKLFKKRNIHYVVIGGWLPQFLSKRRTLAEMLKHFDGIYVETNTMKRALDAQGFDNVFVMPNCKKLTILSEEELVYPSEAPYKLCTFSRVMREKGIEDAVNAVMEVNESLGYQAFSLDIYGQVDAGQTEWFESLKSRFPEYVRYCGCVDANRSVEVLRHYFALLFPTHFYTEGIPGTIIDAYAAGVPVISARWESFSDIVNDGVTGIGYTFMNTHDLTDILYSCAENPSKITALKLACLNKSVSFLPNPTVKIILSRMD